MGVGGAKHPGEGSKGFVFTRWLTEAFCLCKVFIYSIDFITFRLLGADLISGPATDAKNSR